MQLKENALLQSGKYRIICVLGQGGFGITYLAENTILGKQVAIKEFFPKDFCGRDNTSHLTLGTQNNAETVSKLKNRFLKEAQNISKLNHPGIVHIYDVFEENNTAYYVMDFIEGENLNEMVKRNGPLSEEKAIKYIKKVGDALEYIHSRNMTHFDVKPANIVVRKNDDQPILIDFGLSKQYDVHGDATSTLIPAVSNGYSPIELYDPNHITSFLPQVDVYSLGATLYFLLSGNTPPSSINIEMQGLPKLTGCTSTINEVLTNSLSNNIEKRYTSIKSFNESIKNIDFHNNIVGKIFISQDDRLVTKKGEKILDVKIPIASSIGLKWLFVVYFMWMFILSSAMLVGNQYTLELVIATDPEAKYLIYESLFQESIFHRFFLFLDEYRVIYLVLLFCSLVYFLEGCKKLHNLSYPGFYLIEMSLIFAGLSLGFNPDYILIKGFLNIDQFRAIGMILYYLLALIIIVVFSVFLHKRKNRNKMLFFQGDKATVIYVAGIFGVLSLLSGSMVIVGHVWALWIFIPLFIPFIILCGWDYLKSLFIMHK